MLHLGIIGCGKVTTMFHLRAIKEVEEVKVAAVADLDRMRMEDVRRMAGAEKGYGDSKELLSDAEVKVVAINTPPRFHENLVLEALVAGKHVLCEKPLSQTIEGCRRIGDAQRGGELLIIPVHNYAFTPCLESAQELILKDEIGDLQEIDFKFDNNLWSYGPKTDFRTKETYGIVEDILPHVLSVVQTLSDPVSEVATAKGWKKRYPVLDNLRLNMVTEIGVTVKGETNWTSLVPGFMVKAIGTEGTLHIDLMKAPQGVTIKKDGGSKRIGGMGFDQYLDLIQLKHPAFVRQYRHLVATVEGREKPRFTIENEIMMMEVLKDVIQILSDEEQENQT